LLINATSGFLEHAQDKEASFVNQTIESGAMSAPKMLITDHKNPNPKESSQLDY